MAKWVRMSPRKARLVVEHIRGRSVPEARTVLAFTQRAAAREIEKVLQLGRRERRGEPQPRRRRPGRLGRLRGRGPGHEALARPSARPRSPDPEAHLPHHGQAGRGRARAGAGAARARAGAAGGGEARSASRRRSARRPRRRRKRRRPPNGSENPSRRPARGRHPRLEVELVHGHEGVLGVPARGHQDPRAHLQQARARGPVRHPDPQGRAADHDRHLHGAPGDRDRQVRRRGRRAAQGHPRHDQQGRPHQHQRDQAARARREARRAVDRRAARRTASASGAR